MGQVQPQVVLVDAQVLNGLPGNGDLDSEAVPGQLHRRRPDAFPGDVLLRRLAFAPQYGLCLGRVLRQRREPDQAVVSRPGCRHAKVDDCRSRAVRKVELEGIVFRDQRVFALGRRPDRPALAPSIHHHALSIRQVQVAVVMACVGRLDRIDGTLLPGLLVQGRREGPDKLGGVCPARLVQTPVNFRRLGDWKGQALVVAVAVVQVPRQPFDSQIARDI